MEVKDLLNLTTKELMAEFRRLYGFESYSKSKITLRRRIQYKYQEMEYGGLSEKHRKHLKKLADIDPVANLKRQRSEKRMPKDEFRISREWQGQRHDVFIVGEKYRYCDKLYDSLAVIAWLITGQRYNGEKFFGAKNDGN